MPRILIALLLLAGAAPLAAQAGIEITPTVGYRFGGTVNSDGGQFSADPNLAWGATFGLRVKRDGLVEFAYSRQSTGIQFDSDSAGKIAVGDASIEYFQLGGALEFGDDEVTKPYFALTIGGTRLAALDRDIGDEWRFSFGAALGLKFYLSEHVGLRTQARLWMSTLSSDTEFWCSLPGGCVISASDGVFFTQGELSGGVIFSF